MRESFSREAEVRATRDRVWQLLSDVDVLASCSTKVSNVESVVDGQEWKLLLTDRLGPMRLSAPMSVSIVDRSPWEQVRIQAQGQDRGLGTRLQVQASVGCRDTTSAGLTPVSFVGSYDVSGKAANLGSSIVRRQANAMIDEFWKNFTARLDGDD